MNIQTWKKQNKQHFDAEELYNTFQCLYGKFDPSKHNILFMKYWREKQVKQVGEARYLEKVVKKDFFDTFQRKSPKSSLKVGHEYDVIP